jgi:hypothetical protein
MCLEKICMCIRNVNKMGVQLQKNVCVCVCSIVLGSIKSNNVSFEFE